VSSYRNTLMGSSFTFFAGVASSTTRASAQPAFPLYEDLADDAPHQPTPSGRAAQLSGRGVTRTAEVSGTTRIVIGANFSLPLESVPPWASPDESNLAVGDESGRAPDGRRRRRGLFFIAKKKKKFISFLALLRPKRNCRSRSRFGCTFFPPRARPD